MCLENVGLQSNVYVEAGDLDIAMANVCYTEKETFTFFRPKKSRLESFPVCC